MKNFKWFSMILAVLMMVGMLSGMVMASSVDDIEITPPTQEGNGIAGAVSSILGYVQFFAFAIAIGMMIFIGIKYMMAGAGQKAEVKSTLLPYLIGAICVGGASTLAKWALSLVK